MRSSFRCGLAVIAGMMSMAAAAASGAGWSIQATPNPGQSNFLVGTSCVSDTASRRELPRRVRVRGDTVEGRSSASLNAVP